MLKAAIAGFFGFKRVDKEPEVKYVEVPATYAHIDLESAFGQALISLANAVADADVAGTPELAIRKLAECLDAVPPQTVTTRKPMVVAAALHEAADRLRDAHWSTVPRLSAAFYSIDSGDHGGER